MTTSTYVLVTGIDVGTRGGHVNCAISIRAYYGTDAESVLRDHGGNDWLKECEWAKIENKDGLIVLDNGDGVMACGPDFLQALLYVANEFKDGE